MSNAPQRAFDLHAGDYDDTWGADPVAIALRRRVQALMERWLPPGGRVLDLGCGTGVDAAWLTSKGHVVTAVDGSAAMVARATRATPGLRGLHLDASDPGLLQGEVFDAAVLDFGVLNCLDLRVTVASLARLLRPGGVALLVFMPRVHPAALLRDLARGRWSEARGRLARLQQVPVHGQPVRTQYLHPGEVVAALAPTFVLRDQRSLGALLPPPRSRLAHTRLLGALNGLDTLCAGWPALRDLGDHVAVVAQRRGA